MGNNFKKIKVKFIVESLLIALFISILLGLLISSILVLTYKQLGLEYDILLFVLCSVGVFLVSFIVSFIILKPNDIKVAKRIDKQMNLKEKISTMLEYEDKEGYIITKQREDAADKLNNLSVKKIKMHFNKYLLILPLIVLPFCLTSILVDSKFEETKPPIEEPISGDPYIIEQIKDLIREVNEDVNLMYPVKEAYVLHLEGLIEAIDVTDISRAKEVEAVNLTITNISLSSSILNSIDDISLALSNSNLAEAHVLGTALASYDSERINSALEDIRSYLNSPSARQRQLNYEKLINDGFQLVDNERLDADDELYVEFTNLKNNLAEAITATTTYYSDLENVINNAKKTFEEAVIRQVETLYMANYLEERLIAIFELPNNDEPINPPVPNPPSGDEEPTDPDNGGGGGHGDTIYAGDDIFYDPDEGLVPYYEVIAKYSAYIEGLVQDGVISEELANYYIEYFNNLYEVDEGE